ncbi:hypothetical protein Tco_0724125 [Tanacetum coccineum]
MENEVDISALIMEQYIALIPDDIKPSTVNLKIGDDVEFEINANFIKELRRKHFAGTDDEDAYEHVRTVLEIVDLFHFPGVTHDAIMLRVFPIALKGQALIWKDRLLAGSITTWDLLKKEFIWRYCHLFITVKKFKEIRHLKEQMGSPSRTREIVRMIENLKEIHNAKAREKEGDMDVGWDITSKDVERLRQFLTPTIHTLPNLKPVMQPYTPLRPVHDKDKIVKEKEQNYDIPLNDSVMQPLTPQTVHITPTPHTPDTIIVAPTTNQCPNKQLNKLVGYHANDDDGIFVIMDVARKANLKHGLEHVVSLSYRAKSKGVSCSNSTLSIIFQFLTVQ